MGFNLYTKFDTTALEAGLLALSKKSMKLAVGGALQKTANFTGKTVKREVAAGLNVPQKALKDRIRVRTFKKDGVLRVWIGTEHLFPYQFSVPSVYGAPGKTGGVMAGRRRYPGAFMPENKFTPGSIWIRMDSAKYSPELYPGGGFTARGQYGSRKYPITEAVIEIDELVKKTFEPLEDEIVRKFEVFLAAEVEKLLSFAETAKQEQREFRTRFLEATEQ